MELICRGLAIDMENFAFKEGSSKQGNAFLASVGWNCVAPIHLKLALRIVKNSRRKPIVKRPLTQ